MRYLILFLFLVPGIAFAVPALDSEHAFNFSEYVFIGKVTSVEILSEPEIMFDKEEDDYSEKSGIAKYTIQVIEHLKDTGPDSITVDGYFLREPHGMAYETHPYEINDLVKFYLQPNTHTEEDDLIIRTGDTKLLFNCNEAVTNQIPVEKKYHCWSEPMGHPLRDISLSQVDDLERLEFIENHCKNEEFREYFGKLRYLNSTHLIDLDSCEWTQKEISQKAQAVPLCVDENTILRDGVCMPKQSDDCRVYHILGFAIDECNPHIPTSSILIVFGGIVGFSIFVNVWRKK